MKAVNKRTYSHISIDNIGYSEEAQKVLSYLGVTTLGEVVKLDVSALAGWHKCGGRLASEIYHKSREYIDNIRLLKGLVSEESSDHVDMSLENKAAKDFLRTIMFEVSPDNVGKGDTTRYSVNDPVESLRNTILSTRLSEQSLEEFPLFNEHSFMPNDIKLHPSYAGNTEIGSLNLTMQENNILVCSGISSIRDLLMTRLQVIAKTSDCDESEVNDIRIKLLDYLLMRPKTTNLFSMLEEIPISQKNLQLFLEYLCSEAGKYETFKEVGERHNVTKQWVHYITDKYSTYIKSRYMNDGTLDNVLIPVTDYLKKHKGAIRIKAFIEEQQTSLCLDEVSLRRYLRFAEVVTKIVEINQGMDLFWEQKIPCINCRSFKDELVSIQDQGNDALMQIDKTCVISNCPTRKERSFELGQLLFHSPYLQAFQASNKVRMPEDKQEAILDFSDFYQTLNVNLGGKQREILEYIWKNGCEINQTRLEAYCRIKKIDMNSAVIETNATFFEKYGKEMIKYNHSEEYWEINDTFLGSIINETHETGQAVTHDECVSSQELDKPETTDQSKEDTLFEIHKTMLRNTLIKANHSYKFYWAEALFYYIAQGKTVVSFKEMAACMCTYAWDDVLVKNYIYKTDDCIPGIVKELYISLTISPVEKVNTIYTLVLSTISKNEGNKLLRYVPTHFMNGMKCDNKNSIMPIDFYTLGDDELTFNDTAILRKLSVELLKVTHTMKIEYFDNLQNEMSRIDV